MPSHLCGLYRATVFDNIDPAGRSRLRLQCPLFGTDTTGWVDVCLPFGTTASPAVGATVWITFQGGDINHPVCIGEAP